MSPSLLFVFLRQAPQRVHDSTGKKGQGSLCFLCSVQNRIRLRLFANMKRDLLLQGSRLLVTHPTPHLVSLSPFCEGDASGHWRFLVRLNVCAFPCDDFLSPSSCHRQSHPPNECCQRSRSRVSSSSKPPPLFLFFKRSPRLRLEARYAFPQYPLVIRFVSLLVGVKTCGTAFPAGRRLWLVSKQSRN